MALETAKVVVGYDRSEESQVALEWAALVARRRNATLTVVHATGIERPGVDLARPGILEMAQRRAQEIADEGATKAREYADDITIEAKGEQRGAAAALQDYSETSDLVVVGHRGEGRLSGALVGSVAFAVTTHAKCPVAVVRHSLRPLPSQEYPIVVGLDGSEHSNVALDEAAALAVDTGSFLRVVVAWRGPQTNLWSTVVTHLNGSSEENTDETASENPWTVASSDPEAPTATEASNEAHQAAVAIAAKAAERVRAAHPELRVEKAVAEGRPEQVIVNAAAGASLIVVGARGRGDLASLLLGSVSREVMQRADCAVYVVR